MKSLGIIAPIVLSALIGLVGGGVIEKYGYLHYTPLFTPLFRAVAAVEADIDPRSGSLEGVSHQYKWDGTKLPKDGMIDTGLLPIRMKRVRLSEIFPFPKTAGAIATIGNTVVVLDRLGGLYAYPPNGPVTKLRFPPLPNDIARFIVRNPDFNAKEFRAYSILYLPSRKQIAVAHESYDAEIDSNRMAVSVIGIDKQTLRPVGTWKVVFRSEPNSVGSNDAGGGRLVASGSDVLYLSIGDYGVVNPPVAQDPTSSFGKIIRIDLASETSQVFSIGHRNPEGLTITRAGILLSAEHGPFGGDELNRIVEGANYGWPNVTLGTDYGSYSWRQQKVVGTLGAYQPPMFAWLPSIAVSNLIEIQGFDSRWDGDLLVGSLKAESLFRLSVNGNSILYSEPIWIGQRIRDLAQLEDGTIVLWTDDSQMLFLSVDRVKLESDARLPEVGPTVIANCMYCHHLGSTSRSDFAPSLTGLFHRKIGSDNFRYSEAIRTMTGSWTDAALRRFLQDPSKFANGTPMPSLQLSAAAIEQIIQELHAQDLGRWSSSANTIR